MEKEAARLAEREESESEIAENMPVVEEKNVEKEEDEAEAFLRSLGAGEEI